MPRRNSEPTPTQQRVLDYILHFSGELNRPPTEWEVAGHFGWKSRNAARQNIDLLIRKGYLKRTPGVARGLNASSKATRRMAGMRGVPLVGTVPAGVPIDAVEDVEGMVGIDSGMFPEADVFALRVKGESMTGAGIRDGDVALVHQASEAADGDIVVAIMDGEATVKRFFNKNRRVVLHAENPEFKDIAVRPDVDFRLAGVVVGIVRRTKGVK